MLAKHLSLGIAVFAVVFVGIAPVTADWDPSDGHKMHFPQLPDPNGWDVNVTSDMMYDDWRCGGSGPVSDVHFWVSWRNDAPSNIIFIDLEIWTDMAKDDPNNVLGYSYPNVEQWSRRLQPGQWTIRNAGTGLQGWFDPQPADDQTVIPDDHLQYYQINVDPILDPFQQQRDEIYWLGIHIGVEDTQTQIGWKTTLNPWNDDAVYWWTIEDQETPEDPDWREMYYPSGESLNLAFVITPEPATMSMLALGGLALLRRRRKL